MIPTLLLAALLPGQLQPCRVQGTYRQQAAVRTYTAPLYQQQVYAAYAQPVTTAYVAVEYYDTSAIVGAGTRAENRGRGLLQSQADLSLRVDKLANSINGLTALLAKDAQPEPVPPPVAPGKPSPDVPGKPAPAPDGPGVVVAPPVAPPLPAVNPDDGAVPPPPVPSVPGLPVPDVTSRVLRQRCTKCHSAESAATEGGKFAMFTEDGAARTDIPANKKLDLLFRTSTGNMPRKSVPLTPEEQAAVRAWVLQDQKVAAFLGVAVKGPG